MGASESVSHCICEAVRRIDGCKGMSECNWVCCICTRATDKSRNANACLLTSNAKSLRNGDNRWQCGMRCSMREDCTAMSNECWHCGTRCVTERVQCPLQRAMLCCFM